MDNDEELAKLTAEMVRLLRYVMNYSNVRTLLPNGFVGDAQEVIDAFERGEKHG